MSPIFIITDIIQIRQKKRENIKDLHLSLAHTTMGNNNYSQEGTENIRDVFWTPVGVNAVYFIAS